MAPTWADVAECAVQEFKAQQVPAELEVLLTLLVAEVRPQIIIEVGSADGGSAWAWSHVPSVRLIITIDNSKQPTFAPQIRLHCELEHIHGYSDSDLTVNSVIAILQGRKADMVFIDGGHDLATCKSDADMYSEFLRPGGLLVFHDTQGFPGADYFAVDQVFAEYAKTHRNVQLHVHDGGPGGTGIIWMPQGTS